MQPWGEPWPRKNLLETIFALIVERCLRNLCPAKNVSVAGIARVLAYKNMKTTLDIVQ